MDKRKGRGTHLPVRLRCLQELEPLVDFTLHLMNVGHGVDTPSVIPRHLQTLIKHICIKSFSGCSSENN